MSSMTRWTSKRSIGVGLILAAMLLVTIYGFTDNLLSAQATSFTTPRTFGVLNHAPMGTAALLWSQTNHTLVVTVVASGLAPNSTHPDAIHNGSSGGCTSSTHGDVVYGLNPVNADSTGKGTSVTTIPNVQQGIPGQGWYIDMHNGPQLSDNGQQERIACASIINPNALIPAPLPTTSGNPPTTTVNTIINNESPVQTSHGPISNEAPPQPPNGSPPPPSSITNDQVVNVPLGGSADDDQSISVGAVELSLARKSGQLTVKIFLYRLAPKSTHVAHIHNGSCESQGSVLYPLSPVHADSVGFGTSTTVVKNVSSIPSSGWYVNVHRASSKDGLSSQTGFDPIACVDVSTSNSTTPGSTPTPSGPAPTPTPFIE
ncbi:MAG TPA: CHRD domain-containing protein [Ktedonobacteraceae bacterium]